MDQVSRRLSASVMMPVSACCRVLGQVKKSDGMVGSPFGQAGAQSGSRAPASGGRAIGLSAPGDCVAAAFGLLVSGSVSTSWCNRAATPLRASAGGGNFLLVTSTCVCTVAEPSTHNYVAQSPCTTAYVRGTI